MKPLRYKCSNCGSTFLISNLPEKDVCCGCSNPDGVITKKMDKDSIKEVREIILKESKKNEDNK